MSGKNHKMVDGRLHQMDKRYSNLKQSQKKINIWINEEIRTFYKDQKVFPHKSEQFQLVLDSCIRGSKLPVSGFHTGRFTRDTLVAEIVA